jgi:hypothetical protein
MFDPFRFCDRLGRPSRYRANAYVDGGIPRHAGARSVPRALLSMDVSASELFDQTIVYL